jgi:hypothetical protein
MSDDSLSKALGVKELMVDVCDGIAVGHHHLVRASAGELGALVTKSAEVEFDFELTHRTDSDEVGARVGVNTSFWPEASFFHKQSETRKTSRARITLQIVHVAADVERGSAPPGDGGTPATPGTGTGGTPGRGKDEQDMIDRARKEFDVFYDVEDRIRARDLAREAAARLDPTRDPNDDPRARARRMVAHAAFRAAQAALEGKVQLRNVKRDLEIGLGLAEERPDRPVDDADLRVSDIVTRGVAELAAAKDVATARQVAGSVRTQLAQAASPDESQMAATHRLAAMTAFQHAEAALGTQSVKNVVGDIQMTMNMIGGKL